MMEDRKKNTWKVIDSMLQNKEGNKNDYFILWILMCLGLIHLKNGSVSLSPSLILHFDSHNSYSPVFSWITYIKVTANSIAIFIMVYCNKGLSQFSPSPSGLPFSQVQSLSDTVYPHGWFMFTPINMSILTSSVPVTNTRSTYAQVSKISHRFTWNWDITLRNWHKNARLL